MLKQHLRTPARTNIVVQAFLVIEELSVHGTTISSQTKDKTRHCATTADRPGICTAYKTTNLTCKKVSDNSKDFIMATREDLHGYILVGV